MNTKRKERVKLRLAERRKFYDMLRKIKRHSDLTQKLRLRLEPGKFRVTFMFTPEELGTECKPSEEMINKVGAELAQKRLKYRDFCEHVNVVAYGKPTKEHLQRVRAEALEETKLKKLAASTSNLTAFATTAGESNEINNGTTTPAESGSVSSDT